MQNSTLDILLVGLNFNTAEFIAVMFDDMFTLVGIEAEVSLNFKLR